MPRIAKKRRARPLERTIVTRIRRELARVFPTRLILFQARVYVRAADGSRRFAPALGPGCPDLVGILQGGRWLALEVKTPSGRLRPDQRAWLLAARRQGAIVDVVTCPEQAVAVVAEVVGREA